MPEPRKIALGAVLTALVALGPISTDMYLPALPALTRAFGADVATGQLTLSIFVAGFALAQLVYGPLSDRFGRRPVLIGGAVLYILASIGCAAAQTIDQLIAARLFQAVGACAGPVLGRAVVRDIFGRERAAKALAYIGTAMGLVPAAAPILGGYITVWLGWRANFVFLVAFGVVILLGLLAVLAETNKWKDPEALNPGRLLSNYLTLARNPVYVGYALAIAFCYAGLFCFLSGSSFVLIDYMGVREDRFGLFFAIIVVGYMTGTVLAARLTQRVGLDRMILLAAVTAVAAGVAMVAMGWTGSRSVASVVAPMFFFMLGGGIILPNSIAGAIAPYPKMAGAASALLGFTQMTLAALAGLAVGHFHDGTQMAMAIAIAACAGGGLTAFYGLVWRRGRLPESRPAPVD